MIDVKARVQELVAAPADKCPKGAAIYALINTATMMVYVGRTSNLQQRVAKHRGDLRAGIHVNKKLQADWQAYGEKSFLFAPIELLDGSIDAAEMERQCIRQVADACYNMVLLGDEMTAAQRKAAERARDQALGLEEVRGIKAPIALHAAIKRAAQEVIAKGKK